MSRAAGVAAVATITLVIAAALARADDPVAPPPAPAEPDASLAAWAEIYRVLQHPRCRNCHPAGDAPLQHDAGVRHAQNISRRSLANGLTCAACHRSKNSRRPHGPPGAPGWTLPPAAQPMVFEGRSSSALCVQLKDPAQNGGRDLPALIEHAEEPLVRWAWNPGPGRHKPPISHDDFVAAVRRWVDTGAACP